jgi:hypothetical protein
VNAYRLDLRHAFRDEELTFTAPPPDYWQVIGVPADGAAG